MLVRRIVREQDLGDARNPCGRFRDRPAFLAGDEDMDIAPAAPESLATISEAAVTAFKVAGFSARLSCSARTRTDIRSPAPQI